MSVVLKQHQLLQSIDGSDMFDFVWNNAVEGMAFVGMDGEFLAVNPTMSRWLGYAPTELRNMTFMDVTSPSDTKADVDALDEVRRGVRPAYTMAKTYTPKTGSSFVAVLTVYPWKDDLGNEVLFYYSQVQRVEKVDLVRKDELRVVWEFCGKHKKKLITAFLMVAFAGDGAVTWLKNIVEAATGFGVGS